MKNIFAKICIITTIFGIVYFFIFVFMSKLFSRQNICADCCCDEDEDDDYFFDEDMELE